MKEYPNKAEFGNELSQKVLIQTRNVAGTDEALDHCVQIDVMRPDYQNELTLSPVEAFVLMEVLAEHYDYDLRRAEVKPY